ncbi:MAG TPA: hypothetical protein VHW71_16500 [Steroidobacteraceae bacterium]|jgi:hypothetical protein|nr:hypothetical protein [Steroidobacteraceae bacterium]
MKSIKNPALPMIGIALLSISIAAHADPAKVAAKSTPTDAALISSAMSAAPAAVGKNATIVAMEADGKMRILRKGSNGFTCMPDNPATPGPDPMCADSNAMEWIHAWVMHKTPVAGKVGLMYMLKGGTDASNTDPYADKPLGGNHWINTGPHVMIVGAGSSFYSQYPQAADPDTGVPYIMWAGTPYEHLMAPVKPRN